MERKLTYDVVVVGGGASKVAAAIGAADTGKKVLPNVAVKPLALAIGI